MHSTAFCTFVMGVPPLLWVLAPRKDRAEGKGRTGMRKSQQKLSFLKVGVDLKLEIGVSEDLCREILGGPRRMESIVW